METQWGAYLKAENVPKGTFQLTFTNTVQYLISGLFYVTVTKTNALTQADIGALSILTFFSSIFTLFAALSLPKALTKFVSEKIGKSLGEEAASVQKTVTKMVLTISSVAFAISAALSIQLSEFLFNTPDYAPIIILALTYAFLSNVGSVYTSTLQALYLFGKIAILTITSVLISRMIAIILALLHVGVKGVLIGYVAGSSVALVIAVYFIHGKLPKTTHNAPLKPLLHFSFPLFLSSLTLLVLQWADIAIITFMTKDYSLTGIYYIVIQSLTVFSILWLPVTTTIFPALSARHGLKKSQDISNILKTTSRYLTYIVVPACLGLAAISQTALTFFYGPGYTPGALPLSMLSLVTIFIALCTLFKTTLAAIGKTDQILKINVISSLSAIIMLLALVPFLEVIGATIARSITQIIAFILATWLLRKEIVVQLDKEALWKSAVASIATIPFLLMLETTLATKLPIVQTLTIEILTAVSVYAFSLYVLKALNSQDFELLRQAFPKALTKYITFLENIIVR